MQTSIICMTHDPHLVTQLRSSVASHLPTMKKVLSALALISGVALATSAHAQLNPVSVTGTGTFTNSPSLISDGVIPPEETWWTSDTNVYWNGTEPTFTLDYGAPQWITKIVLSVDNNDQYTVSTSLNGVDFTNLFVIQIDDGNVPVSPGGMDTFSTDPADGPDEFSPDIAISPTLAQYIRIQATDGDNDYAVGELDAYGTPATSAVPEPSTYGLIGAGLLGAVAMLRRRKATK